MKPKIVQVTAIGMSQVKLLSKLNQTLIKQGYEVHSICSADDYTNELTNEGIIFHDVKIDRSINLKGNLKTIIAMIKVFKKIKPDIVHVHTPVAAVLGRIAAKLAGVPHVLYTAHGFYFHEGMSKINYKIFYIIEKYVGRFFTDQIFIQSKEDFDLAIKGKFLKNDNYLHISNGIDLDEQFNIDNISEIEIEKIKLDLKIDEKDVIFTFLGRMVKEKGIIELLEAFTRLNEKNSNTKLLCMGSFSNSERDIETNEKVEKYKNNNNIKFIGQVKYPENYYALCDVFVLPSYREGMPRSIIEAMSMKTAIIATDIRGSREEVVHDSTGLLVEPHNVDHLYYSMKKLLIDKDEINKMKENGYRRAHKLYNEKDVVKKQLVAINGLLRGK